MSSNSTYPKPFGRPVSRSVGRRTLLTFPPHSLKKLHTASSSTPKLRLPTKSVALGSLAESPNVFARFSRTLLLSAGRP
jgi:hypothetical protein